MVIGLFPLIAFAGVAQAAYSAHIQSRTHKLSKQVFDKLRDEVLNAPPITHPSKKRTTRESGKRKDPRW